MKKFTFIGALLVSAFIAMGCQTTIPAGVSGSGCQKVGSKVGEASGSFLFGLPIGKADFSLKTAATMGGIKDIGTVDIRINWPAVPVYVTVTTVVTGE